MYVVVTAAPVVVVVVTAVVVVAVLAAAGAAGATAVGVIVVVCMYVCISSFCLCGFLHSIQVNSWVVPQYRIQNFPSTSFPVHQFQSPYSSTMATWEPASYATTGTISSICWVGSVCDLLSYGLVDCNAGPNMRGKNYASSFSLFLWTVRRICGRLSNNLPVYHSQTKNTTYEQQAICS
jgi:hypothetical protein